MSTIVSTNSMAGEETRPSYVEPIRGVMGKVLWFNSRKQFGFLLQDGTDNDIYVNSNKVIGSRPLRKDQKVRFDIVNDEAGRTCASAVEIVRNTIVPGGEPETDVSYGQQRSITTKAPRSIFIGVHFLHVSTFTLASLCGDPVAVLLLAESGNILDDEWMPRFSCQIKGPTAVVARRDEANGREEKNVFDIRCFYHGEEIDWSLSSFVAASRALWDRRIAGIRRLESHLVLRTRNGDKAVSKRVPEKVLSRRHEHTNVLPQHCIEVTYGTFSSTEPICRDSIAKCVSDISSLKMYRVGFTLLVDVGNASFLPIFKVDLARLGVEMSDIGATAFVVTASSDDEDIDFESRVFERVSFNSTVVIEGIVHGQSRLDLSSFWAHQLQLQSMSSRERNIAASSWSTMFDADKISITAPTIIMSRGTLSKLSYTSRTSTITPTPIVM